MPNDAIYARYSSHAQDDSSSIEVQIQHCERTLGGTATPYIDAAKTGRSVAGRTELARLISDAKLGKVSRVCVWRFSRIGRNLADSAGIIQELEDCGVQVISAMEGSDPLVRSIFLGMAEHYSRELATNTRDGLAARFMQKGITGGTVPFGYQVVEQDGTRKMAILPGEADIIRQLAEIYLRETIGLKGLAMRMHSMGTPTRHGSRWSHTTVRAILSNTMLVGQMRFLRRQMKINRQSGRRVPKFRQEPDVLSYDAPELRILTDEQFKGIQSIMASRKPVGTTPQQPREVRAFTGFAFCAECGSTCYTCKSQNSKGTYHYLACGNRCRLGKSACPLAGRIREDKVLSLIQDDFAGLFDDTDAIISGAVSRAEQLSQVQQNEAVRIRSQLSAIDQKIKRYMGMLDDADFDPMAKKSFGRQIGELERERDQLFTAMGTVTQQAGETTERLAKAVRMAMDEARASLASIASPAEFNRFVERFVGPFVVNGDGSVNKKSLVGAFSHPTRDIAGGGFEPPTSGL